MKIQRYFLAAIFTAFFAVQTRAAVVQNSATGTATITASVTLVSGNTYAFDIEFSQSGTWGYTICYLLSPSGSYTAWFPPGFGSIYGSVTGQQVNFSGLPSGSYVVRASSDYDSNPVVVATFDWDGATLGGEATPLPQRKLSWTVTNSNSPPPTAANLETWAIFQFNGTDPTGIAFAHQTVEAGQSATLTIYVAENDSYNYAPGRVDYQLSIDTYGGFPRSSTAYALNSDGTPNYGDPEFTYMEGALPVAGSTGTPGNYASATQVTAIPSGTTGPGVHNTLPLVTVPAPSTGGMVTVVPGSGGTTTSTDSGTASAVQQGANAIIQAVNNTGQATRQAIDRNTAAINASTAAIVQALESFDGSTIKSAVEAGNAADQAAREAEQAARESVQDELSEAAIGNAIAQRDAQLASKDAAASALFAGIGGGMTAAKVTPSVGSGDSSAWLIDLDVLGSIDINPFTNAWVQEKMPFLNWLVALFRVTLVWGAQVAFYRWLVGTIKENAIAFMHTPSPPVTSAETMASSNPVTALLGKIGAVVSSLFLAVLILSSLSTIISIATTWGTISSLVDSIQEGTNFMSSAMTGLGAALGNLGRIVYLVTAYLPVAALLGIGANYVIIETGLVATMPVLIFAMRIRRW